MGALAALGDWLAANGTAVAVGAIATLVAGVLAWVIGRPVAWWTGRTARSSAQRAICLEIGENLSLLRSLWADINRAPQRIGFSVEPPDLLGAVRLAEREPAPRWSRAMWDDPRTRTAAALAARRCERVGSFYRGLGRFDALRSALGRPRPLVHNPSALTLLDDGRAAWREIETLVTDLLESGNPLGDCG